MLRATLYAPTVEKLVGIYKLIASSQGFDPVNLKYFEDSESVIVNFVFCKGIVCEIIL